MTGRTRNLHASTPANPTADTQEQPLKPWITPMKEVPEDLPTTHETPFSASVTGEPSEPTNKSISVKNILEHLPQNQAIFLQGMLTACKHPQTESLDMISRDTCELKRNFLKPQSLKAIYQTTIYKSFCKFAFEIDSQAQLCDMEDEEAITYTMTGLYYTEVKDWLDHLGNDHERFQ
ncbi:uncharacterized protein BDCG_16667 [Blastomyces dermatitidis ER-3]|uniref:Uncharacterized protein n=1 Tax=Ajellomyces dermatitidis (strain ER-3 / ATCC MYA-2586) TaxID=559297 RepID=A0ABX2VTN0_AJEDR|nr:uncharacterized protein BDCG_16667 [Blastomyces dermatitidis ER-3]OAT00547.1 hypothetical protein BDCG_16667 [Blastomyces dermatitidis ER-3]